MTNNGGFVACLHMVGIKYGVTAGPGRACITSLPACTKCMSLLFCRQTCLTDLCADDLHNIVKKQMVRFSIIASDRALFYYQFKKNKQMLGIASA